MNVMVYVRGSMEDYDNWASFVGDEGWSAASMQGYMRKHQVRSVTNQPETLVLTRATDFRTC